MSRLFLDLNCLERAIISIPLRQVWRCQGVVIFVKDPEAFLQLRDMP